MRGIKGTPVLQLFEIIDFKTTVPTSSSVSVYLGSLVW